MHLIVKLFHASMCAISYICYLIIVRKYFSNYFIFKYLSRV